MASPGLNLFGSQGAVPQSAHELPGRLASWSTGLGGDGKGADLEEQMGKKSAQMHGSVHACLYGCRECTCTCVHI